MKTIKKIILFICLPVLLTAAPPSQEKVPLKPSRPLPGLVVGIVRAGEEPVILTYGKTSTQHGRSVDENTLFPIASCTKAFTCHLVCRLVERGELSWEEGIPELPGKGITLRHMASHTTGYPRSDDWWVDRNISQDELMERFRALSKKSKPGKHYEYSNLGYLALGKVVERTTGTSWGEEVEVQIFRPLGMKRSSTDPHQLSRQTNAAKGHRWQDGKFVTVPYQDTTPVAPAGAICSTGENMVKWVDFQLTARPHLLSSASLQEMRTSYSSTPDKGYGLGWFLSKYRGRLEVEHAGGIRGFSAHVSLLPSEGIGVVLLTNCEDHAALVGLTHQIYDQLLDRSASLSAFTIAS